MWNPSSYSHEISFERPKHGMSTDSIPASPSEFSAKFAKLGIFYGFSNVVPSIMKKILFAKKVCKNSFKGVEGAAQDFKKCMQERNCDGSGAALLWQQKTA